VAIAETGAPVTARALVTAAKPNRRKEGALKRLKEPALAPRARPAASRPRQEEAGPKARAAANRPAGPVGLQPVPVEAVTVPSGTSGPAGQRISNLSGVERVLVGEAHGWLLEVAAVPAWAAEALEEGVEDVAAADVGVAGGAPM
jgi:hypothetical protein